MSFYGYGKKDPKEIQLNILHRTILRIARRVQEKKHFFDMLTLFEACCREIPNPEPEIFQAIRDLYKMKYIIEGKKLFKEDILTNKKRNKIYEYVKKYPGVHEREIRQVFGLGAYMAYRHLNLLEAFGFLRKKYYYNKSTYFPSDFEEAKEAECLLLRNETTNKIYDYIKEYEQLRITEIKEFLQISYTTIQSHLNRLIEGGLVKKIKKGQKSYYILAEISDQEELVEVKREYDFIGGEIRFKVAIRNRTTMAIHNIAVNLNPSDQFTTNISQQNIANLPPNTTRGIDFMLTPITCGQSKVFGSVSYEDAFGNIHSLPIRSKEISIKCPLVEPLTATQLEVNEWIKNLRRATGKIQYNSISDADAFRIGREQVGALDLSEIEVDSEQKWALYSGQVKITGNNMVVKLNVENQAIILDVWADDLKQTTGFIAYITNLINIALEISYKTVRNTEEVTKKITNLIKASGLLDEIFTLYENLGTNFEITTRISNLEQLLTETIADMAFIRSIKNVNTNLISAENPDTPINEKNAIELRFKSIQWLKKIHELIQYHIKTYQDIYSDINQISIKFTAGLNRIGERILIHEEKYALGILFYLMILDKKSGITLFERNLGDLRINSDLVGGFLHALQNFGTELSASETSMKTLTYENYQFQIETGNLIRAALILRGAPNQFIITRLKQFVKQFEQNFEEAIKYFSGNIDAFRPASALFEVLFK
ncbi:MAG: hypothetical protein HWN66_18405 [Candidatus Helarchaeota archaeon]|nr:hypothetical protein [Candidatus Helarchaeota archaeon]